MTSWWKGITKTLQHLPAQPSILPYFGGAKCSNCLRSVGDALARGACSRNLKPHPQEKKNAGSWDVYKSAMHFRGEGIRAVLLDALKSNRRRRQSSHITSTALQQQQKQQSKCCLANGTWEAKSCSAFFRSFQVFAKTPSSNSSSKKGNSFPPSPGQICLHSYMKSCLSLRGSNHIFNSVFEKPSAQHCSLSGLYYMFQQSRNH